jgi:hypothetical protein
VIGAVGLALLVEHLISNSNKNYCKNLLKKLNPSPAVPPPADCI